MSKQYQVCRMDREGRVSRGPGRYTKERAEEIASVMGLNYPDLCYTAEPVGAEIEQEPPPPRGGGPS